VLGLTWRIRTPVSKNVRKKGKDGNLVPGGKGGKALASFCIKKTKGHMDSLSRNRGIGGLTVRSLTYKGRNKRKKEHRLIRGIKLQSVARLWGQARQQVKWRRGPFLGQG